MKKLLMLFTFNLLFVITLHAQSNMEVDYNELFTTYYVPIKRLAGTVMKACDGNVPFGMKCKLHEKICWCNSCAENYNREKKKLYAKYKNIQSNVSTQSNANTYKNTLAQSNPSATATYQAPTPVINNNQTSRDQGVQAINNTTKSIIAQYNTTNSEQLSPIVNNINLEVIKSTPINKTLIHSSNSSIQAIQSTTQSIVDKFQQNQQSAQALQTTLNSALNSYLQVSQAKLERELVNSSSRSDARLARLSTLRYLALDNAKKADSLLYQSKEYEKATLYYLNLQLIQAYLSLNDCSSANVFVYKKEKEGDAEGTKNYFLFPYKDNLNDNNKVEEISIEKHILPDLYKIPICKVYTNEPVRKPEYEKAFAFLRKSQDCNFVNIHDLGYRDIKYSKKIKDNFNEDSALYYLQKNVYAVKVDNAVDLLDYTNTLVWYNCLQTKHAQTTGDLYNGLKACIFLYKNLKQWTPFIRKEHFTIYDYQYTEVSLNIINYYFLSYYFQLAANSNDLTTKKWAANCMSLITNRDKNYNNQSSNKFSFPYSIYSNELNSGAIEYYINYYSDASLLNIPVSN